MRRIRVVVALCLVAMVVWAWPGSAPLAAMAAGGKEGGTLRLAFPTNIASLDPVRINEVYTFLVGYQIYEGLVDIDENFQVIPALAESWEQQDETTWVFRLRPGVTFADDPAKADDSRWVHRGQTSWERLTHRHNADTLEGRVFQGLQHLLRVRRETVALAGNHLQVIPTDNPHVLGFVRRNAGARALVFANFSEHPQTLDGDLLRRYGLSTHFVDALSAETLSSSDTLLLAALQLRILRPEEH